MKKTKLLVITDSSLLSSGLAETTRLTFLTLLKKYLEHYDVEQLGLWHVHAVTTPSWPIHPTKMEVLDDGRATLTVTDRFGEESSPDLIKSLQPDIVFAFNDPQKLKHLCIGPALRNYKLVLYVNFDGVPLPPVFEFLLKADRIITMSEFAKNAFVESIGAGEGRVGVIYSPADTERFHPISRDEKRKLRSNLFPSWLPQDAFVLGWVGRNQWRKQVWILCHAIHVLRTGDYTVCSECGKVLDYRQMPPEETIEHSRKSYGQCLHCNRSNARRAEPLEDMFLWLHMPRKDPLSTWSVDRLEDLNDVRPGRDIHYTECHGFQDRIAPTDMPLLYQLWDALLYLSGGEGFGIPAWEAMCTGLPVIYTDYSSHAEFLNKANAGMPVKGTYQPDGRTCILRMVADLRQVIEAVRTLYFNHHLRMTLGQNGLRFVTDYSFRFAS